ncbi:hypothetical protein FQR65_LT17879 [Abscondita terminalis]|nr:hypothetical protein FQR65_LT17879 [Abscondita terminalis]
MYTALISRPSKKLENLNAKQKERHDAITQEVSNRCKIINEEIEIQIRLNSELLKQTLYGNENKLFDFLKQIDYPDDELIKLDESNFEAISKNVMVILELNRSLIDEFYYFLIELEKERTYKYKNVLKYEYSELHKISYLVPYELQKYFGFKILNYNQILLNDLRYYADLHKSLLIQVENKNRLCMQQYDKLNNSWKYLKKREMLQKLNEMLFLRSDVKLATLNNNLGKTTSDLLLEKQNDMSQIATFQSGFPLTAVQVDMWSKKLQETLESIDFCAHKLMSLYKMAVVQIFNGYFEELEKVDNQICRTSLLNTDELNLLNVEICKPTIESVTQQYSSEMFQVENHWESVIIKLQQKLQTTYVFLKQAGLLWDEHFDRIYDLKLLVLKDLKIVIAKNDKWQNVEEMALSVAIDKLRQASTQNDLDSLLSDAIKKIDAIQNAYKSQCKNEIKVLLKYEEMVDKESDVLLAELEQILHLFPKEAMKQQSVEVPLPTESLFEDKSVSENEEDTFKDFLLKRTIQLEFQIDAIENWMLGLKEAMEVYMTTCKADNEKLALTWIEENIKKVTNRLNTKLGVNNSKYDRIKCSVYDVRLSELKMHSERLQRHKAGAEKEISDIKSQLTSLQSSCQIEMTEYKLKIQETLSKIETIPNTSKAKNLIRNHNNSTEKIKQKVTDLFERLQVTFNARMAKIKSSSMKFCTQMKLFYEGGNFNASEATSICKDLKKYEGVIKKLTKSIKKDISKHQKKTENEIAKEDAKILPILMQCLQEFQFNDLILAIIQNIQIDLKRETYNLKFFIKKADDQLEQIQTITKQGFSNMQDIEVFQDEFKKLCESLTTLCAKTFYPPPQNDVRKLSYPELELPAGSGSQINSKKTSSSKSQKTTKSNSSKVKLNYHDYAGMLFDNAPPNIDSVMPQLCSYLLVSLQLIQDESQVR